MARERCPCYTLPKDKWQGNIGEGVENGGQPYRCVGRAYNTGCICLPKAW